MKQLLLLVMLGCGTKYLTALQAPHIITFFMTPATHNNDVLTRAVSGDSTLAHEILKGHLQSPLVQGIYVTYKGYITYSDYNGQVVMPQQQDELSLTLVITDVMYPVILEGSTIHHLEIPEETAASFYAYVLTHDTAANKWFWNISELKRPPSSRLPADALVIMAHPDHIVIQQGTHKALPGPNLVLPDIEVDTLMNTPFCVLKFLKINRFFEPLTLQREYKEQSYAQVVMV